MCICTGSYLPTEKAEKAGRYSAYIFSGNVGHEGGDLLTRTTITQINQLFEDRRFTKSEGYGTFRLSFICFKDEVGIIL